MSNRASRSLVAVAILATLSVAGCASSTGSGPAGATTAPPGDAAAGTSGASTTPATPPADADTVDHPTGATDIVLRVNQTGGFMMLDTVMARVPPFTLYGDGRVLLVPSDATPKTGLNPGAGGGPVPGTVLREGHLTEDQVQSLLRYALTDGHLGIAKELYTGMVMDLPTTTFEIHAGGVEKRVSVGGLGAEPQPGPDSQTLQALAALAGQLQTIATTADYAPGAYMAVLSETEPDPARPAADWPWPTLAPATFVQPLDTDPTPFAHHLLSIADAQTAVPDIGPGGVSGLRYKGPDGRLYTVAIRPALPEEIAAS